MKRIIFLTPSVRLLGARQSLLALATHLPDDIDPLVVCPASGGLTEELQRSGIEARVVPHGAWRKLGGRATALWRQLPALRRIVRDFQPDVIHANEFHSTPQATVAAGRRGGNAGGSPPISESGGKRGEPMVTSHVRLGITHRQVMNYYLGRCDRIAAVSEACRHLFDGTGLEGRVETIYNGVDVSHLAGAEAERGLRESLGWGDDAVVAGLFGLISPRKNQMVAAEAVAIARQRGTNVQLLIAGDAFRDTVEYGEELKKRLAADDIREAVHWLPFQRDVRPLYGAIDLNLLISAEEGFGRTIIEAGALARPSVGARTGGIPELIAEGESGWLVDEGSAEQLAATLCEAAANREELARRGTIARDRIVERFTIEAHVANMLRFWQMA